MPCSQAWNASWFSSTWVCRKKLNTQWEESQQWQHEHCVALPSYATQLELRFIPRGTKKKKRKKQEIKKKTKFTGFNYSLLVCIGEGRYRWSWSCTGRPSWGSEQNSVNECSRGTGGISNCTLWERMLPKVINQRWGRLSHLSAAQQSCLHRRKWYSTHCH